MNKIWILTLTLGIFSCNFVTESPTNNDDESIETVVSNSVETEEELTFDDEIAFSKYCFEQLKLGKAENLNNYTSGKILFSAYAHIDEKTARKVSLEELTEDKEEIHFWGFADGTGDSILMTTPSFLEKNIFSFNINNENVETEIYNQNPKPHGSELYNLKTLFPNSKYAEFYLPPSTASGMDWRGLVFVVSEKDGQYRLRAIIQNQWTV